jgi:hypothetical protein
MERVTLPSGYVLNDNQRIEDILAVQEDLLRSEGVDPRWPGFGETTGKDAGRNDETS